MIVSAALRAADLVMPMIACLEADTADAGTRRGIYDYATALAQHVCDLMLHAEEGATKVYVENAVPLLQPDFMKPSRLVLHPSAVECEVDAAERFDGLATAAATSSGFDTSDVTVGTSPPAVFIRSAVSCSAASPLSVMTTRAPSAAKAIAVARPIPLAAPVTNAVFSSKRFEPSIAVYPLSGFLQWVPG
jgi:hypothetical protein